MKNSSVFFLFLLLAFGELSAQQLFVLYEPGCMLRLQYEQAIARQPRMDYFSYQIPLANGQKLVLETGVEGNVKQNYLPPDYLRCNDPRLNAGLMESINSNTAKVFMLVPDGNDYLIQPVAMGAVLAIQNNTLTYVSPLASFQFDTRNVIIGENLAYNNPNAKVFFEGRESMSCTGGYLIRQLMPRNAYPVIDYKMNPVLGVLERRLGSDGETTVGGVTMLRGVNGQALNDFITTYCANTAPVAATSASAPSPAPTTDYAAVPATYGSGNPTPPVAYTPPAPVTTLPTAPPVSASPALATPAVAVSQGTATHTVVKGETLYALSRRYQVEVAQIKAWNGLVSNTINIGQQLKVSEGARGAAPIAATSNYSLAPPLMEARGPVATSNPGAAQPVPYGGSVATPTAQVDEGHIVQAGETVASIALRYGYTEAKYREINGLGANEFIRIGQRLKTNDCPDINNSTTTTAAPTVYGASVVTPSTYVAPNSIGTPVGPTSPSFQPQQQPAAPSPQYYNTAPATPQTYNLTAPIAPSANINNNPSFGQKGVIVPQAYQGSSGQSMNSLESAPARTIGTPIGQPATYGQPVTNQAPAATRAVHVVQEGESLYSIANRYGLTVDQLRGFNGLGNMDVIIPFQRLYIN